MPPTCLRSFCNGNPTGAVAGVRANGAWLARGCCLGAMLLWLPLSHGAASLIVSSPLDSGPGSLRQALSNANTLGGGVITFANVSGTILLQTNLPDITQPVSIIGPGATVLSVSGNKLRRVFRIRPGAVCLLSGLTIKDGNGQCDDPHSGCDGGGVLNEGQLTILDCCITNSRVVGIAIAAGGGISSTGSLTMSNVAVVNNSAYTTGGIKSIGNLNMTNCSIVGNGSHQGVGGIYCIGTNNIVKCQINHNGSDAGGLWVAGVTVITDTSISGNMAEPPWGIAGGIFSTGVVSLVNCTLSGNIFWDTYQAPGQASAIVNIGTLSAVNCTIISNQMWGWSSNTAGVYNSGAFLARNTIIANSLTGRQTPFTNLGPDFAGALASQGFNLIRDPTYAVISGDPTGNIYGLDPLLGPLGDNGGGTWTHALLPGSPAIDAGTIFGAPLTDQRGVPRPQGQRVDIGAYEVPCPQCGPLMITQLQRVAEGCTVLTASGIPGDICQVLGSADSLTWQPLGTGTNVAGTVLFTDGTCSGVNNRFYRLQKTGPPAF